MTNTFTNDGLFFFFLIFYSFTFYFFFFFLKTRLAVRAASTSAISQAAAATATATKPSTSSPPPKKAPRIKSFSIYRWVCFVCYISTSFRMKKLDKRSFSLTISIWHFFFLKKKRECVSQVSISIFLYFFL